MKKKGLKNIFKNKRALSTIIVTLILIFVSLVAVGIFWVVISNVIKGNSENIGLGRITFNAEISQVHVDNSSNNVSFAITRKVGAGDIVGMKFIFENETGQEIITESFTLNELASRKFLIHLNMDVTSLKKISIVPLFQNSKGESAVGNVADSYTFKGTESRVYICGNGIAEPGEFCDGTDGLAGGCENAGTFNGGNLSCTSSCTYETSQCTYEPPSSCTPTTNPCGSAVCGTAVNGTCGNVSCGTCGSGYNCVGGICVMQMGGNCSDANILCVDDTAGATQEYSTIQACANAVLAGQTCLVYPGIYNERITFTSGHSGSLGNKITFKSQTPRAAVVINGFNTQNSNYLRIEGFNITNKRTEWDMVYGVWLRSNYVEIVDNYFYDINDSAIRGPLGTPYPTGAYIVNNTVYGCKTGLFINAHNSLVENNIVERLIYLQSSWVNDCDYARFFGENITFRNNRFYGTSLAEIASAHADCFQTYTNNGEITRNILFYNNTCSDAHQGLMASNTQATDSYNFTFTNNIFFNLWAFGIGSSGIRNVTLEHNTLVNTTYYGFTFSEATTSGVNGKNNILYNVQTPYATQTSAVATFDYNLRYLCGNPNPIGLSGAHDLIDVNPLFVNLNNKDFRLQSGSPACTGGEGGTYLGAYPCN